MGTVSASTIEPITCTPLAESGALIASQIHAAEGDLGNAKTLLTEIEELLNSANQPGRDLHGGGNAP